MEVENNKELVPFGHYCDQWKEMDPAARLITLDLELDESICTMYDYFDIFLGRMQMCRHGAEVLGARFKLVANGSKVL